MYLSSPSSKISFTVWRIGTDIASHRPAAHNVSRVECREFYFWLGLESRMPKKKQELTRAIVTFTRAGKKKS